MFLFGVLENTKKVAGMTVFTDVRQIFLEYFFLWCYLRTVWTSIPCACVISPGASNVDWAWANSTWGPSTWGETKLSPPFWICPVPLPQPCSWDTYLLRSWTSQMKPSRPPLSPSPCPPPVPVVKTKNPSVPVYRRVRETSTHSRSWQYI